MRLFKQIRSRHLIYAAGAVIVLAIVAVGVSRIGSRTANPSAAQDAAIPVTAGVAVRADVPDIISAIGTVQSIDSVAVQARVTGAIQKIEFTPGQDVKEGQELFLIDPRPYQAALDEAQAQLAHDEGVLSEAELDLARYQMLAQQNSIAKQQAQDQVYVVQQDKGTVQLDQANVEAAQLNLTYCHVTAPIAGRAGALLVDLGNLVGPAASAGSPGGSSTTSSATGGQASNSAMVMIAQTHPIYVSFNVPQTLLDQIKRNQAAAPLEVDAYSQTGKLIETGRLTLIDNRVNTNTGTVLLQGTFLNNDEALWPGEFVRAQLHPVDPERCRDGAGTGRDGRSEQLYVYVINSDRTVRRVDVAVTDRRGGTAVIGKGLSGGEHIVVDGQYRLANGVKVDFPQTAEASSK